MNLDLVEIDKNTLLRYVTPEAIFCKYLEIDSVEFDKAYTNILRKGDKNPGCTFFLREADNKLVFHDWAKEWKADCFDVVMAKFNCTFVKALERIAIDFEVVEGNSSLKAVETPVLCVPKAPLTLMIARRKPTEAELRFWSIGGFTVTQQMLEDSKIFAITAFWEMRGDDIENTIQKLKMTFAYKFKGKSKFQIYRPSLPRSRRRFINSPKVHYGDLEFLDRDANYVVITKSKKDSFYLRLLGVNAFFILTEQINLDVSIMYELQTHYDQVFTLFDNDWTGMRRSIAYKNKHNTMPLLYAKEDGKDTAGTLENKGKYFMYSLIEDVRAMFRL